MDAPDLFNNFDPSAISRSKAEEMLLYVRYLLNREQEPDKLRVYGDLKLMLEARLEALTEREILPPLNLFQETSAAPKPTQTGEETV